MRTFEDAAARITRSSANAATGYATAAFAAYADFASQAFGLWAQTLDAMVPKPEPRSWYRHPDKPQLGNSAANPFAWMTYAGQPAPAFAQFWGQAWAKPALPGMAGQPTFNPFEIWLRAWPLQGNPAAWPMAFALMGAGLSRQVAYPTAEANAAVIDVISTATEVARERFSTYRSDGGHATAQIIFQAEKTVAALMLPVGANMLAPWLAAFDAMPRSI